MRVHDLFADRTDAGGRLADYLKIHLINQEDIVVLGLPRGGVPLAAVAARALNAPLDILVVRKLGLPAQPELAMGAIAEGDFRVLNPEVLEFSTAAAHDIKLVEATERRELSRRASVFRKGRARVSLVGKVALIIDDGIATGSTARVACMAARAQGASRVILAVPVAPNHTIIEEADEFIVLKRPSVFSSISEFYTHFPQVSDEEVIRFLAEAWRTNLGVLDVEVQVPVHDLDLQTVNLIGHLLIPTNAKSIIIFAHGSGSSRHSPRNQLVSSVLQQSGFGTFLFDLLSEGEARDRCNVFNIPMLGSRLLQVTTWLRKHHPVPSICYFGASTGGGAALWAASQPEANIVAVVSRGGRPDLAGSVQLHSIQSPTLLIVGGKDTDVIEGNKQALEQMSNCMQKKLEIVPGASHLFEEPGALQKVAELACNWFEYHTRNAEV